MQFTAQLVVWPKQRLTLAHGTNGVKPVYYYFCFWYDCCCLVVVFVMVVVVVVVVVAVARRQFFSGVSEARRQGFSPASSGVFSGCSGFLPSFIS